MIFLHSTYIIAVLVQLVPYSISNTESQGGEIISGLPCVKRLNQLYCGSAGKSYPAKSIDKFIDDNKALLRRMSKRTTCLPGMMVMVHSQRELRDRQTSLGPQ